MRSTTFYRKFQAWLRPFLVALGHKKRRHWCPLYLHGLYARLERKSVRPVADLVAPGNHEQIHHFVCTSHWDTGPLEQLLAQRAQHLVGGKGSVLIVDDTTLPKSGLHSVGVAHQYSGVLGKMANCQTLVSLTLAKHEQPIPIALRLFLPSSWTDDPERCAQCGVPADRITPKSKSQIALDEIDRVRAAGVSFDVVLADAGYGMSAAFRQGLSQRDLRWAVGVPRHLKVYSPAVRVVDVPKKPSGRPQVHPTVTEAALPVEFVLKGMNWRRITWRVGTKGPLRAKFVALRARVADGPKYFRGWHLPGEEVWVIGEWRSTGERKYYLSNLPASTPLTVLARTIKGRWACEYAHQMLKGEFGLDHFEGRSWRGLHHHALLCMIALAFVQSLRSTRHVPTETGPALVRMMAGAVGAATCPFCGCPTGPPGMGSEEQSRRKGTKCTAYAANSPSK